MSDFHQSGVITTLHKLGPPNLETLEAELEKVAGIRPVALVLPCLYSELETPAMPRIAEEIRQVRYLKEVVVALARANEEQFAQAREFFATLPQKSTLIWIDGSRVQGLLREMEEKGLTVGPDGKGRSAWLAYGYVLGKAECDVIALHDSDIASYGRDLLARLVYPVANPKLGFEFCKGYYSRVTDRLHGRATRLLVTPLLRALQRMVGHQPFLTFMDSFRYPLAGEFAMIADLARANRIPGDWGLEVGVLAEVYRNVAPGRVCQSDLSDAYEHKHQALSAEDPKKGLMRMAVDITKSVLRTLAEEGLPISDGLLKSLPVTYLRTARDVMVRYQDDASINSLAFDQHEEGQAVEAFARAVRLASDEYLADPVGLPLIPNWNRVLAAMPDIFERLLAAAEKDNG
ncbi:MAG: glycosyl transferase [Candidatus Rokubacteria bacterium]|nr:glycosyl transferase [Candidatus Rokubacteria bacterium]